MPLKLTTCGVLRALSLNVKLPVSEPATVGAKATVTMQVLLGAATIAPEQVSAVLVKFAETVMVVNIRFAVPVFVTVTA